VSSLAIGEQYRIPNSSYWSTDVQALYTVNHPDTPYNPVTGTGGYTTSGPGGHVHLHKVALPHLWARTAYSGAGFDPDAVHLYIHGGGHAAAIGNEVLRFKANQEVPAWEVFAQPSDASNVSWCNTGAHVPPLAKGPAYNGLNLDGKPISAHMCTRNFYLPGDASVWHFGGGVTFPSSGVGTIHRLDSTTREWSASYGVMWQSFNINPGYRDYRDYAIVDSRDDSVYLIHHGTGNILRWGGVATPLKLTSMGSLSAVYKFGGAPFMAWPGCIDTARDQIVIATGGNGNRPGPLKIVRVNTAAPYTKTLHEVTWLTTSKTFWHGHSLEYDSDGDRYLLFEGRGFIYTIDATTLEVDQITLTGHALPSAQSWWMLNRFRYSSVLKGTLFVSTGPKTGATHDGCSVYFVRLHK
jgi:hypothetical protein